MLVPEKVRYNTESYICNTELPEFNKMSEHSDFYHTRGSCVSLNVYGKEGKQDEESDN